MKNRNFIGEKHITNEGYEVEIIEQVQYKCSIKYEDDTIKDNVYYFHLKSGNVRKPFNRIGEQWLTNEGYIATIIQYNNTKSVDVILPNGVIIKDKSYIVVRKGHILNPYHKSRFKVGYLGVGAFDSNSMVGTINIHDRWVGMLERCYGKRITSYEDVTVCTEWHNFQNFAEWFEENWKSWIDSSWQLDKDIVCKKCRIYSPETCVIIPREVNRFFVLRTLKKGNLPIGVFKDGIGFGAQIVTTNKKYLGYFTTLEEAFQAYKKAKENYSKKLADKWKDKITEEAYIALINYTIEITD